MKNLPSLLAFISLLAPAIAGAAVKPNNLFTDGAVLQRGKPVPVWGTADDGEKVTVKFKGQTVSTVAKGGKWMVRLEPLKASAEPANLTIRGTNNITVGNVLVGEVWICSGQSNMQWQLKQAAGGPEAAAASEDPQLRLLTVPREAKDEPQADFKGNWTLCNATTSPAFSAVAYYFGRDLRKALKVPVGLISTNVGGTPAEAWTSLKALEGDPVLKEILKRHADSIAKYDPVKAEESYKKAKEKHAKDVETAKAGGKSAPAAPRAPQAPKANVRRPCGLYNAMIAPLVPYAIQGAIWYQGESNNGQPKEYQTLFPAMIGNWRAVWKQGDFPFLFVQIAPHKGMTPELREAQLMSWKKTPNTAMAVITDVGDANDIHPKKKEPVGARLALAARALAYTEQIEYSGPVFKSLAVQGNKAVVSFTHVGKGLVAEGGDLKGFTIAGSDKKFVPAEAEIVGKTVVVSSPEVAKPVAVRYGWTNIPEVNLTNKEGLPATPFRSDVE